MNSNNALFNNGSTDSNGKTQTGRINAASTVSSNQNGINPISVAFKNSSSSLGKIGNNSLSTGSNGLNLSNLITTISNNVSTNNNAQTGQNNIQTNLRYFLKLFKFKLTQFVHFIF